MKLKATIKQNIESLMREIAINDMKEEGTNPMFLNFTKPITNTLKLA